jgi:hypothetical protein
MGDSSSGNQDLVPNPNNDDDEGNDLMDIRLPSGMMILEDSQQPTTIVPPQKPAENHKVDDQAILDCWNLTVDSHESVPRSITVANAADFIENKYVWQAKDFVTPSSTGERCNSDILVNWQPRELPLPPWAVDPFEMKFIIKEKKSTPKM